MTFTINKEYSKSKIKTPRNSAKTCPKLTKTSKRNDTHCCVSNWDSYHNQCRASSTYLEQAFVGGVDVQSIFKNDRRNKKVYTKCKIWENSRSRFSTP